MVRQVSQYPELLLSSLLRLPGLNVRSHVADVSSFRLDQGLLGFATHRSATSEFLDARHQRAGRIGERVELMLGNADVQRASVLVLHVLQATAETKLV